MTLHLGSGDASCKNTRDTHGVLTAYSGGVGVGVALICPVPGAIDSDHMVPATSARLLHGNAALSHFVISKIFWVRYFETM